MNKKYNFNRLITLENECKIQLREKKNESIN